MAGLSGVDEKSLTCIVCTRVFNYFVGSLAFLSYYTPLKLESKKHDNVRGNAARMERK